jgi:hypothetical protein
MRKLLLLLCALLAMNLSLEARKKPASQNTAAAKAHRKQVKKYAKAHKAKKVKAKHHQSVN